MKNRRIFLTTLILSLCIFCKSNGQASTSSIVVLRGYVVIQFKRQEVIDWFKIKSRSIPIDSYQKTFFLPFGDSGLDMSTDSLNVLNSDNIVFLQSKETNELITDFLKDKTELLTNSFALYNDDSIYFQIKGKADENYLYKYYYVECKALKTTITNNSKNVFSLNIPYNKAVRNLICYFAFNTTILQVINSINSNKIQRFEVNRSILPH